MELPPHVLQPLGRRGPHPLRGPFRVDGVIPRFGATTVASSPNTVFMGDETLLLVFADLSDAGDLVRCVAARRRQRHPDSRRLPRPRIILTRRPCASHGRWAHPPNLLRLLGRRDLIRCAVLLNRYPWWARPSMRYVATFTTQVRMRRKLSVKVKDINSRLEDIIENKDRYKMEDMHKKSELTWKASTSISYAHRKL